MKNFFILLCTIFLAPFLASGQGVIESFDEAPADTSYWLFEISEAADSLKSYTDLTYIGDNVQVGDSALQVDWGVHNSEAWGGYAKFMHWHPDSNGVFDFSAYDTISFWYNNVSASTIPSRMVLRLQLFDVSHSPNGNETYSVDDVECYYSFFYVLDNDPGWNKISLPMINDPNAWNGEAFNRTGWAGIEGNNELDKDKIKGYAFEFSISGSGEGDNAEGTIILDHIALSGASEVSIIFFNGRAVPSNVTVDPGWGGGSYEITDEEAYTPGTNSIKWNTPPNDWAVWDGLVFALSAPKNLVFSWSKDSAKFKIKADAGLGPLKLVFADPDEDGDGDDLEFEAAYTLEEAAVGYDGTWKIVEIPLRDFDRFAGGWNGSETVPGEMDSTKVNKFKILIASTDGVGKVVYLDDIWTDNPYIDIIPPDPPTNVSGVPNTSEYYNLVIWTDVPDESGETYTVYADTKPITDINDPDIDIVASDVAEGTQTAVHYIKYPLVDKEVTYYYAAICKDAAGNASDFECAPSSTVNTGKGIATISLSPPASFTADGNLEEWDASGIMPFIIKPSTDYVYGEITDDADLSGTVWLAIDDNYLYVAGDVIDNTFNYGGGNWWEQDALELFIGLYDWRGPKHTSYKSENEPDYKIVIKQDEIAREPTWTTLCLNGSENFYYEGYNPNYVFEGRISLDSVRNASDYRFHPERGMRIPMEIYFHDNDGSGWEGNLGCSPYNTDHAWQSPAEWTYTWIGDTTHPIVGIDDPIVKTVNSFSLKQNYPNPFNPLTKIEYSIAKSTLVQVEVYNILGQKVRTLMNKKQQAGKYTLCFKGKALSSGVYFYQIKAGDFTMTRKMLLVK